MQVAAAGLAGSGWDLATWEREGSRRLLASSSVGLWIPWVPAPLALARR